MDQTPSVKTSSDADPTVEKINPHGDIIFVTNNGRRFLTHSAFLRNASPVWDAMLSGRFAEGQDLSSERPKEISADDDNPDALLDLLRLVHVRYDDLPAKMTVEKLYDIAVLADKYACVGALRLPVDTWFMALRKDTNSFTELGYLAAASAALNQHASFEEFTRKLAFEHSQPMSELFKTENTMLPPSVLCKNNHGLLSDHHPKYTDTSPVLMEEQRKRARVIVGQIATELSKGLLVVPAERGCSSLSSEVDKGVRTVIKVMPSLVDRPLATCFSDCQAAATALTHSKSHGELEYCDACCRRHPAGSDLKQLGRNTLARFQQGESVLRGLCLTCIRAGSATAAICKEHKA
ncbi:hypothetical protein ANO11243_083550 [Dothideomycetidae sp. 11243]|nr:hypothetical protein ANO11243_083550 [fungal sp. No.11243]